MVGLRVLLMHPEVASRPCEDCRRWIYKHDGTLMLKAGQPIPRPKGTPTPCQTCPKIPKDAPIKDRSQAIDLSEKNRSAWWHYQQCKAVGQFPDDALVRRNAALIARVLKSIDDVRLDRLFYLLGGKL
jgi:hypothetical protein